MEHHVAGQRVAVCLGAALRVEHLRDVAQVAEDVESVEGKSAAIADDYVYVRDAGTIKASPAMDVDGALRSRRIEADIIAFEATKGLVLPTASPDDEE